MMNRHEREALDRHITGNYGEDQFKGEREMATCDRCGEHYPEQDIMVTAVGWVCPTCREIYLSEVDSHTPPEGVQLEFQFEGDPLDDPRRGQGGRK